MKQETLEFLYMCMLAENYPLMLHTYHLKFTFIRQGGVLGVNGAAAAGAC